MNQVNGSPIPTTEPHRFPLLIWLLLALFAVGAAAVFAPPAKSAKFYHDGFVPAGHPIDIVSDRNGRWYYYFMPRIPGGAPQLAAQVRRELLPQGFTEDTTSHPWFRFVKGSREVIVCNHDEIGWNATRLIPPPPGLGPGRVPGRLLWPVLWVHQPGLDSAGVARFQAQRFFLHW